ncbi:protocadherin Fat 1-like isoform X2 [Liolophura sinensis]|uniref:protocadherin Fat 1-like isoform X2 n=1 Tax=Liolophura sinensis TaxID=3198878 RepID=UPI003158BC13
MAVRWTAWAGVSSLLQWLVWIGALHLQSGAAQYPPYLTRETFHFTKPYYNASIVENSIGKTYVTAMDKMGIYTYLEGPQIDIYYEIVGGDEGKIFKPEEYIVGDFCFLRIRTHTGIYGNVNRELHDSYTLQVKAVGKYESLPLRLEAVTEVKIWVEDANDLSPLFEPREYDVVVNENAALHSSVAQVTASDADVGVNGEIYYSFLQDTKVFAIHPTSGIVYVTRPLSYSDRKEYLFDVLAEDRGPKKDSTVSSTKTSAKLHITVIQVNFFEPVIAVKNLPAVVEHGMASVYAILTVSDADKGNNGKIGSVDIIAGNREGLFQVAPAKDKAGEYVIEVKDELDREIMPWGYNLTVLAMDKGSPAKSTTTSVHVKILDTNDNAPKFAQKQYKVQVEETVPVNTPLLFVEAGDKDLGKNAEILYSIKAGNSKNLFKIHQWKGLLSTAGELDAETQDTFELVISAVDQGNTGSRKEGTTRVSVKVIDCNDNSPVFNVTSNSVFVDENKPVGTDVFQVSAYDLDRGENSYLSFSIANLNPVPFDINRFTGVVRTTDVLDFESMRRTYKIKIRASDWGAPFRRESEKVFTIRVRDVNDNTPEFEKTNCTGYVAREAPLDTELLVVSAIDQDVNNIVSYQIVDGNTDNCFDLDSSTGKLLLKCTLMNYPADRVILVIKATDSATFSTPMMVNITLVNTNGNVHLANNNANIHCKDTGVIEKTSKLLQESKRNNDDSRDLDMMSNIPNKFLHNEHTPVFDNNVRHALAVSEGMPVGATVLQLKVTDEDPTYNGMLVFSISSGDEGFFKVDTKSGALTVLSKLDRELNSSLNLTVKVSDLGEPQLSSTTFLAVTVLDENDCAPKFDKDSYSVSISEDVKVGAFTVQVSAVDKDQGKNSEVTYSILSDTDDFHIDGWSGVITVNLPLNREMQDVYYLLVQAMDAGQEPLSSTTTVTVTVEDINDNRPYFIPSDYTVKIREDLPVGTVVMTITAQDPDIGGGGLVKYMLQDGTDGKFSIDHDTGVIRIVRPLDFEKKQVFNITGVARDNGNPAFSSECKINIEIIDVNENLFPPEFRNFVAKGSVKENEPLGSVVMQVVAKDPDLGGYRPDLVLYSIREGTGLGRFTIDSDGTIRTNQVLDRETASHYWLTVYAQDRGVVPLHSRLDVFIEVEDLNDNIPQTIEPAYYASVVENSKAGVTVVKIEAEDGDQNPLQRLQFDITGGNPQGFFRIDPVSGAVLTTKRRLDRERQSEHILEITVSDNGQPNLSSTSRVVVKVEDENDNAPQFTERVYRVRILEPLPGAQSVSLFRVVAFDKDSGVNAEITYTAKGTRTKFHVHPKTGEITALSPQDLIKGSDHSVSIKAEDGGSPPRKSIARVRVEVLGRPDRSVHPPKFDRADMTVSVMEDDKLGSMVALLGATDDDHDKLWYNITGGNEEKKFVIGIEDGIVLLAQSLDWEQRNSYNLTISVTDGVHTAYCWLNVKVQDNNDNAPVFSQTLYIGQVSESAEVGTSVLEVTATDLDKDNKLLYTIHGAANRVSMEMFQINSLTGQISVKEPLDHEALNKHQLVIMARDKGVKPYRSFAKVVINVQDHNDHAPEFLSGRFEGRVFETAAIGTSVVQVMAFDRDKGDNAEIQYSIVSGNVGNAFGIDEKLGTITVSEELDRNEQSSYLLVVKATDKGEPSMSSTARVKIFVTISNNAPPKFRYTEYTSELEENSAPGEAIVTVNAESCSSVVYEIIHGDDNSTFSINPNSGILSNRISFDYEKDQFFNLTVQGTNMVGATATTYVLVHIVDMNDNRPEFLKPVYVGNITECTAAGSVVLDSDLGPLVIQARDKDFGRNGLLVYEIMGVEAKKYFSIDSSTGAIKTAALLNHEEFTVIEFEVKVSDTGKPQLTTEEPARVVIYIEDINDSPPEFSSPVYNATVLLPTYKDVHFLTLEATDPDTDVQSNLVFQISDGNDEGHFGINNSSGALFVIDEQNMSESYSLAVTVSDGEFTGKALVNITVKKTENSGLEFTEDTISVDVMENVTGVKNLAVIQVKGHVMNEHLTFSILNPSKLFKIGPTSGVLQTTGHLFDRETRDRYSLVVEVRDARPEPRLAHIVVSVTVLDKNDNAPMFVNQPYYSILSVESGRGETVLQVLAIDKDLGENGAVTYRLVDGAEGKFTIHRSTGEIYLSELLTTVQENTQFDLLVEAMDRGTPSLKSQTVVPVKVITKATPVFSQQYYSVSIPENIQLHSPVISLQAGSPNGQKLIYSITKGDKYGEFAVDFNTDMDVLGPCVLYVVDRLDNEGVVRSYELTLRATDVMTGSYSETTVMVELEDVNDNAPQFESQSYMSVISEAVRTGSKVLSVSATDQDEGMNKMVRFSLADISTDRNDSTYFQIDSETGVLSTRLLLDQETQAEFRFFVVATDSGMPALSSSSLTRITLSDLNDNPPTFDQPSYNCLITEQLRRGEFVTKVTASDPDSSDAGQLQYSIVGGNDQQAFIVEKNSGIIRLSDQRTPNLQSSYTLNISVTDQVFTNFARVQISVKSLNNYAPKFSQDMYYAEFSENIGEGMLVTTVSAVDQDIGTFGALSYSITSALSDEIFRMDADTGEMFSRKILDRETQSQYEVPIAVTDNGGFMAFSSVLVTVSDMNDNVPQFLVQEYKGNVYHDASINSTVLQLRATDDDTGDNGDVVYSIFNGENSKASEFIDVDPDSGVITVKDGLENSVNQVYQFFVHATDRGSPSLENNVPVEILVMGPMDAPPMFDQPGYSFFIPENTRPNTIIATITAQSNDTVTYSIVPGFTRGSNNPAKFSINGEGKIRVLGELDRETTSSFTLTIRAETPTTPPLVAHTQVHVQIMDINDNCPQFESNPYLATVPENTDPGIHVIKVKAFDNDTGVNAEVRYAFTAEVGKLANMFAINSETGEITLLVPLDREEADEYNLTVIASDRGSKESLSNTTLVTVRVMDHNDEAPVFSQTTYSAAVNEDALPGTVIVSISTSDGDLASDITYYVTSGDPLGQFSISKAGEVYVNRALDREAKSRYKMTIMATDGGFVTTAMVVIDILDANDNAPNCDIPLYQKFVTEDVAPNHYVTPIIATDADEHGTRNARIKYSLEGEGAENFNIDEKTGYLTTAAELDREVQADYKLLVHAVDGGGLSCTTEVYVAVKDVNDNAPVFTMETYTVTIAESAKVNTLITRVSASDEDLGINRKVKYRLKDRSDTFSLDEVNGIISLIRCVDREITPQYSLAVEAYDQGNPSLSSEAMVQVVVLDINDNPPEFELTSYSVSVQEDVPTGTAVVTVLATSRDVGINAVITYSIVAGNELGKFTVGPSTGVIRVDKMLDHEASREFFLTVQASDGGSPTLSNTAVVNINVTDVNDMPPRFSQPIYSGSIREDAKEGETILQVMATDEDSPPFDDITYSIIKGDPENRFLIGEKTGVVTVGEVLDREQTAEYTLTVVASDGDLLTSVDVTITIKDANDCPPVFQLNNHTVFVQEDRSVGYNILTFKVEDCDLEPNAGPFSFDIISGNQGNEFRVDSKGTLLIAGIFRKQVKDVYNLTIRVFDNGLPTLYTDTSVIIHIIEESSYPPKVGSLSVGISSYLDEFPGGLIGQVLATDDDIYDRLTYTITSPNKHLFNIDEKDGRIIALPGLDAGDYVIVVSVTDGKYYTTTSVNVEVQSITQEMVDNAITIQLENLVPEEFLQRNIKAFKRTLKAELSVRAKDIEIISVQPAVEDSDQNIFKRQRRAIHGQNLDVLFAVRKSPSSYYRSNALRRKVSLAIPTLESALGVPVVKVFNDICERDFCDQGECFSYVEFNKESVVRVVLDDETYVTAQHKYARKCQCHEGYGGEKCSEQVTTCIHKPCPSYMLCRPHPAQGYQCECPVGRTGPRCEEELPKAQGVCTDVHCQRGDKPMTFSGRSYARWRLVDKMERRLSLAIKIKTRKATASLMYATGQRDYSILELINGMVQFKFNLGSGQGAVLIPEIISDGNWHEIIVERNGNFAEVMLNGRFSGQVLAPEPNDILNLYTHDVYFGAEVTLMTNGYKNIQNGFEGCMDDIKVNGVRLPASGSNSVATSQDFKDVEFHCRDSGSIPSDTSGACGSFPCLNGGQCISLNQQTFHCQCLDRFRGQKCEIDSNPCASNPCMYGGVCSNVAEVPNDFMCKCDVGLSGKRCNYGRYCHPDVCINNGVCIEGPNSAICQCDQERFAGKRCELNVDPCFGSPCLHGGICQRRGQTYTCNCTEGTAGVDCKEVTVPAITPSLSVEEIYGIIGCLVGLLLIVIVFVSYRLCRRRQKRRRGNVTAGIANDPSDVLLNSIHDDMKRTKLSNLDIALSVQNKPPSPRPPPVPNRPASYTPSNHDSVNTLNNFDTVRNYGSAADDLESIHNIPVYNSEYLQTFTGPRTTPASIPPSLPPPPPSNSASDSDSIQKAHWEFDYPNIMENYGEDKKYADNLAKMMPGAHMPPTMAGPCTGSFSSLPVSESEDDLPGYHWDTSDWAPHPSLPNISEVPMKEILDSPSSSPHSHDSNTNIGVQEHSHAEEEDGINEHSHLLYDSEYVENESEYVGDSEYADNEFDDEYNDDPTQYPSHADFQQILALQAQLQEAVDYELPRHNLNVHPDQYLPHYSLNGHQSEQDNADEEDNGNRQPLLGAEARAPEENIIHYGFPRQGPRRFMGDDLGVQSDCNGDFENSQSALDDMSVSVGGYTSTNASCSDISGLCEIEDSEINLSDEDSTESSPSARLRADNLHTQV